MLLGKYFHLWEVINGNAVYERQICIVDGAEIRIDGKRIGNIKRNPKHDDEEHKRGEKEKSTLHWISLCLAMDWIKPRKFIKWNGYKTYQYKNPGNPRGEKKTVCERWVTLAV